MCPYYDSKSKTCLLYKTLQTDYQIRTYCMQLEKPFTECLNYKEAKRVNGGTVPPPYKYKYH